MKKSELKQLIREVIEEMDGRQFDIKKIISPQFGAQSRFAPESFSKNYKIAAWFGDEDDPIYGGHFENKSPEYIQDYYKTHHAHEGEYKLRGEYKFAEGILSVVEHDGRWGGYFLFSNDLDVKKMISSAAQGQLRLSQILKQR
jgi:hypothetical protein